MSKKSKNPHNSKKSSLNVRNPAPSWRSVFIALVLALAIGGTGQTRPVQAAPAGELANFSMRVQNPKTTLRCGQTATYYVSVELAPSNGAPTPTPGSLGFPNRLSVINVKVEAFSSDKNVGDFIATEKGYATAETAMVFDEDLTGLAAKFKFKANKPGKTTLHFEGLVGKEYVSANLEVKVLPCKFKVKTVLQFPVPELYNITVIGDDAVMTGDETGTFTGSATMYWVYSEVFQDCDFSISASDSLADLTGQLDDNGGQFVVTETFQPTTVAVSMCCPIVGCRSNSEQGTVYPLIFNVASSGGVVTQTVSGQGVSGLAHIIVVPEEDEAVSFNAKGRMALSSPAWWTMLWDEFPSLFGALLALH